MKNVSQQRYTTSETHDSMMATRNGRRGRDRFRGKEKQQFSATVGSFRISFFFKI
jgi:hypothetical protein